MCPMAIVPRILSIQHNETLHPFLSLRTLACRSGVRSLTGSLTQKYETLSAQPQMSIRPPEAKQKCMKSCRSVKMYGYATIWPTNPSDEVLQPFPLRCNPPSSPCTPPQGKISIRHTPDLCTVAPDTAGNFKSPHRDASAQQFACQSRDQQHPVTVCTFGYRCILYASKKVRSCKISLFHSHSQSLADSKRTSEIHTKR